MVTEREALETISVNDITNRNARRSETWKILIVWSTSKILYLYVRMEPKGEFPLRYVNHSPGTIKHLRQPKSIISLLE